MTAPTLVIPVRDEGENFRRTYDELVKFIPAASRVLVVYDRDDDTTLPVLKCLESSDSRLRSVKNNLGAGIPNALRTGFASVDRGPVIVVMGDLSDDLKLIPEMVKRYETGAHVVCPSRYMPGGAQIGGPRIKKVLSRLAGLMLYWTGSLPVRDATNNFRLYDGAFLKQARLESSHGFEVALELAFKAHNMGLTIEEIPTTWCGRSWGKSNFQLFRALPHYLKWWLRAMLWRLFVKRNFRVGSNLGPGAKHD